MSLVGPRPERPEVVSQIQEIIPEFSLRVEVKPGLTGWAQIKGRASLPWDERIELDLWYIEHRSLSLDLKILSRTTAIVFGGEGLYKGDTGGGPA